MGTNLSNIIGFGNTEDAAFESFRACFVFHHSEKAWIDNHFEKKNKDDDLLENGYFNHRVVDFMGKSRKIMSGMAYGNVMFLIKLYLPMFFLIVLLSSMYPSTFSAQDCSASFLVFALSLVNTFWSKTRDVVNTLAWSGPDSSDLNTQSMTGNCLEQYSKRVPFQFILNKKVDQIK